MRFGGLSLVLAGLGFLGLGLSGKPLRAEQPGGKVIACPQEMLLVSSFCIDRFESAMVDDFRRVLEDHCAPIAANPRPWGWKEPRSIYLLSFLHRHLPALRFLHVVRDGRDMALSKNQN